MGSNIRCSAVRSRNVRLVLDLSLTCLAENSLTLVRVAREPGQRERSRLCYRPIYSQIRNSPPRLTLSSFILPARQRDFSLDPLILGSTPLTCRFSVFFLPHGNSLRRDSVGFKNSPCTPGSRSIDAIRQIDRAASSSPGSWDARNRWEMRFSCARSK